MPHLCFNPILTTGGADYQALRDSQSEEALGNGHSGQLAFHHITNILRTQKQIGKYIYIYIGTILKRLRFLEETPLIENQTYLSDRVW